MDDKLQDNLKTVNDSGSCRYTHTVTPISTGCNEADSIYEEITEETYEVVGCSDYEAPPIELMQQNDSTYTVMK